MWFGYHLRRIQGRLRRSSWTKISSHPLDCVGNHRNGKYFNLQQQQKFVRNYDDDKTLIFKFKFNRTNSLTAALSGYANKKSTLPLSLFWKKRILFYLKDVSCNGVGNFHSGEREAVRFHEWYASDFERRSLFLCRRQAGTI